MLDILSHSLNPLKKEWWKHFLTRRLLNIERGPDAVRASLIRGLNENRVEYRLDPRHPSGTVVVLSGVEALREALAKKAAGLVKRLVAGPNITIDPNDHDGLMLDPLIDIVLVPSLWTRAYWANSAPSLDERLVVWAAGVAISEPSTKDGLPIIYDKIGDGRLLEAVQKELRTSAVVFKYGQFSRDRYLQALQSAPFLVYLAESESQGLALQEAWAHDVPTLVNESHEWRNGEASWQAPNINAPYLTNEAGYFFSDPAELPALIKTAQGLRPRAYCERELSDRVSATKLLDTIYDNR